MNRYKIIDESNLKLIFEKCKMKFDYDLEPFVNKETRELTINDENYYNILEIIQDFLAPLKLVEVIYE